MSVISRLRTAIHVATAPMEDIEKALVPSLVRAATGASSPVASADALSVEGKFPGGASVPSGLRPVPGPIPPAAGQPTPDPIRYQFGYGQNNIVTPRSTAKNPFALLRGIAEFSHIRTCIETRKDQMTSLQLEIRPRDQRNSKVSQERIAKIKAFFEKPDKKRSFHTWLKSAIEEVLVIDALSIYRRRTFGGELYSLDIIDGSTILPLIDARGDTPAEDQIAYRQIAYGYPIVGGDCTVKDLLYRPRTVRTHTVYGLSPTEWVLLAVNAAINRDMYNLAFYTEGDVPESIMDAPENWNVEQLREFETHINNKFAGQLGARRKMKILASGMSKSFTRIKDPDFTGAYDEWLLKVICAAFAVPPSEIGFTADINKATGKQQENVVYRRGVKPLSNYFQDIFNEIIAEDLKEPEIEAVFTGGEPEDKLTQARTDEIYMEHGVTSPDEVAQREGREPVGLGRYVMTTAGPMFAEELVNRPSPFEDSAEGAPVAGEVAVEGNPTPPAVGGPASAGKGTKNKAGAGDQEGSALEQEIKKYRANAIGRKQAGKSAKPFTSVVLPVDLNKALYAGVEVCDTVGDVVELFDSTIENIRKARTIVSKKSAIERKIRTACVKMFSAQGDAVVAHLKKAVDKLPKEANS